MQLPRSFALPPGAAKLLAGALALALACATSSCGSAGARVSTGGKPVITVATGLWPLAQMATDLSQGRARVIDVVPRGQNPRTYKLTASQRSEVRHASVVLEIGRGFQPSFESSATKAHRVVALLPAVGGTNPDIWLNPGDMIKASELATAAFVAAAPSQKQLFDNGERDFKALLSTLEITYQDSLSDCPLHNFVTASNAFSRLDSSHQVRDLALSPQGGPANPTHAEVRQAVAKIRAAHARMVLVQPFQPSSLARTAAAAAGVPVGVLDTLENPTRSWPANATYDQMMDNDLATVARALACPGSLNS